MSAGSSNAQVVRHVFSWGFTLSAPHTSLASANMDLELWKEHKVVATIVGLLIIARAVYGKSQVTGRPPVVPYVIPWVGSAIDLGRDPDAFFKRAMYAEWFFMRLETGADPVVSSDKYGDIFAVKAVGRTVIYVTSPHVSGTGCAQGVSVDIYYVVDCGSVQAPSGMDIFPPTGLFSALMASFHPRNMTSLQYA